MTGAHAKGKAKECEFLNEHPPGFVYPMGKYRKEGNDGIFAEDGYRVFWDAPGGKRCWHVVFFQVCHKSTVKRHIRAIEKVVEEYEGAWDFSIELWSYRVKDGKTLWCVEDVWSPERLSEKLVKV